MRCGALILAAGASKRFGRPKQLALLREETLLERTLRTVREAGCSPVIVVLGAREELVRMQCDLRGVQVVSHAAWAEGMGSSLAAGARALPAELDGALVLTCDMPLVTAKHLQRLAEGGEMTASFYAGRKGVPAYFPQACFLRLTEMSGDVGARELLRGALSVDLEAGELDVDTAEQLERAAEALGKSEGVDA